MASTLPIIPRITLSQLQSAWFVYNKTAYSALDCSPFILKAALKKKTRDDDAKILLGQDALDPMERWFVLNYSSLKLYPSRELAEQALHP
jgi:hypothetical protein